MLTTLVSFSIGISDCINNLSFLPDTTLGWGENNGKQTHLEAVASDLSKRYPDASFSQASTLLIDDDKNNVNIAIKNSVRGLRLHVDAPDQIIEELLNIH